MVCVNLALGASPARPNLCSRSWVDGCVHCQPLTEIPTLPPPRKKIKMQVAGGNSYVREQGRR